jgi:hypothetical protein
VVEKHTQSSVRCSGHPFRAKNILARCDTVYEITRCHKRAPSVRPLAGVLSNRDLYEAALAAGATAWSSSFRRMLRAGRLSMGNWDLSTVTSGIYDFVLNRSSRLYPIHPSP